MQFTKEALVQRIRELEVQKRNSLAEKQRAHDNACAQEGAIKQCQAFIAKIEKAEREAAELQQKCAAEAAAAEEKRQAGIAEKGLAGILKPGDLFKQPEPEKLCGALEAATGG